MRLVLLSGAQIHRSLSELFLVRVSQYVSDLFVFYTDGWMDGWMDGRMDGRMDGWTVDLCHIIHCEAKNCTFLF